MLRLGIPATTPAVTYFTVSTHRFFLGTVALLNSLRLTGNVGELVVLDAGLTQSERELLSAHATVFAPPKTMEIHPVVMKTYAHLTRPSGTVVVIDSDMIVTGSLDHVVRSLERAGSVHIRTCRLSGDAGFRSGRRRFVSALRSVRIST